MAGNANQLSRYGAIAKEYPFVLGKVYFLLSSSEALVSRTNRDFPVDSDGEARIFSTWATAIAATTAGNGDAIAVSPNFTTAPTLAQIATMDASGVTVFQMGQVGLDGSYWAAKAGAAMNSSTPNQLFQINGRIQVLSIVGESTTAFGGTSTNIKLTMAPTVGAATDITANASVTSLDPGVEFTMTGVFTDALQKSSPSVVGVIQTASSSPTAFFNLQLPAGILQLKSSANNSGTSRWKIIYKPIDPGAFVSAL